MPVPYRRRVMASPKKSQDTTDVIYAEDEEVFRETAVRELLKLGFLRPVIRWMPGMG